MSKLALSAVCGLVILAAPAAAQADPEMPRRFTLEALGGLNTFLPTIEFQLGYRLPLWDDRLEPFLGYSPWSASLSPSVTNDLEEVGLRAYMVPSGPFQPYAMVSTGISNASDGYVMPAAMAGLGLDCMPSPSLGFTFSATVGIPFLVRPMVGARLTF